MNTSLAPQLIQAHHAAGLWLPTALPNCVLRVAKLLEWKDLASLDGWELCELITRHALPGDPETPRYSEALHFQRWLGAPDDLQDQVDFWRAFLECVASHRQKTMA